MQVKLKCEMCFKNVKYETVMCWLNILTYFLLTADKPANSSKWKNKLGDTATSSNEMYA